VVLWLLALIGLIAGILLVCFALLAIATILKNAITGTDTVATTLWQVFWAGIIIGAILTWAGAAGLQ